jgi:hypothetical protein
MPSEHFTVHALYNILISDSVEYNASITKLTNHLAAPREPSWG